MTRSLFAIIALSLAASTLAWGAKPKTEDDKAFYALGLILSDRLAPYSLSKSELAMVTTGLQDGVLGKDKAVDIAEYGPKLNELVQARALAASEREKKASADYVADLAKQDGAQRSESGLLYFETAAGDGPSPAATDTVRVHYHGMLRDGTVFDSSVQRGTPATFALNRVIPCWTEGVQKMQVGGKAKLVCPSDIAYGDRGSPPRIMPGAALVFEVELLGIE